MPDLDPVRAAHARLLTVIEGIDDDTARRPSLLPGWSVGHVLTHIARNADSFTWLCEGTLTGEVRDQYPGGAEQREGDIEAGAGRPAADLVDDLRAACARLEAALEAVTDWSATVRTSVGPVPVEGLLLRRLRETEIHAADLGLGRFTWHDWSDALVDLQLAELSGDHRRQIVAFLAGRAEQPPGLFG